MAIKKGEGTHEVVFSRVTIPRWGENMEGWLTRPQSDEPTPALLVVPDAWGITGFIEACWHRLSRQGYTCLAVEPYSRGGRPRRSASYDDARSSFAGLPFRRLVGDLRAGVEFLRKTGDVLLDRIGVMALGNGGRAGIELASDDEVALRCLVLLYAALPNVDGEAARVRVPLLGLYGAEDQVVPADSARTFSALVAQAGARPEVLVYPQARETFLDDERDTFDPATADDAWTRILRFLDANLRK